MGEAAKKQDEETLIPVGPGAEGLEPPSEKEDEKDEKPEDSRLAHKEEDEPEPGEKPEKRRESSRERRERAKKSRDRERLEFNFLLKRNEDLEKRLMRIEGRTAQNETASIDQRINQLDAQIGSADRILAEALKKPNGGGAEEFTEALKIRDQLRDQRAQLAAGKAEKERSEKAEQAYNDSNSMASRPSMEPTKPDPRVIRHAREWANQHDWFDFSAEDEDSRIVRAIDEALSNEGWDPASPDYWEELSTRVKRRLPEKFKNGARSRAEDDEDLDEDEDERPKKTGPKFSSGGRERPLKKGEVYVSAERKQAMKDYGVWDDPVARNRMLQKYAQWDAELAASNRS